MKRDGLAHSYVEESLDAYRRPSIERERVGFSEVVAALVDLVIVGAILTFFVYVGFVLLLAMAS